MSGDPYMVRMECDTDLNAEKIIEMHNDIIKDFGGEPGLRDPATIEYVVYRVNRSRNSFRNAAIALYGIATGHPFIDGNKRTALVVAENILADSGYYLDASEPEVVGFMVQVAQYNLTEPSVEGWIKERARLKLA